MASTSPNPDFAAGLTSISKYVNGDVANNTITAGPLWYFISKEADVQYNVGGVDIQPMPHIYQVQSPVGYNGRNIGSFPDPVNFRTPTHNWCGYIVQYMTLEWDRLVNQPGSTRRFDREAKVLEAVKDAWQPFFETKFWLDNSASAPPGVVGVPGWLKASGSYGGVTQSSNASWTPTRVDGSSAIAGKTFATDPVAYFRRTVYNHAQKGQSKSARIPGKLNRAFMTQAEFEFLLSYFTATSTLPITVKTGETGNNFDSITVAGVDCYWSPNATSASIAFLNTKNYTLYFQTDNMFVTRMSEPTQPIGQCIQIYNKFQLVNENPYQDAALHTTGVT